MEEKKTKDEIKPKEEEDLLDEDDDLEGHIPIAADFETSLRGGFKSNCRICTHEAAKEAAMIYVESNCNLKTVRQFLLGKDLDMTTDRMRNHFERHVKPYTNLDLVKRERRQQNLLTRAAKAPTMDNFSRIREIIFEFLEDIYTYKPTDLSTSNDLKKHISMAKELTDLIKTYKELCVLEWDQIGHGRSDEEQKQLMRDFVVTTIKKELGDIKEEHPEAYKKMATKLGIESPE